MGRDHASLNQHVKFSCSILLAFKHFYPMIHLVMMEIVKQRMMCVPMEFAKVNLCYVLVSPVKLMHAILVNAWKESVSMINCQKVPLVMMVMIVQQTTNVILRVHALDKIKV